MDRRTGSARFHIRKQRPSALINYSTFIQTPKDLQYVQKDSIQRTCFTRDHEEEGVRVTGLVIADP